MRSRRALLAVLALLCASPVCADAEDLGIPVLVPLTGFLAVEGASQRNGAVLALRTAPGIRTDVSDTGTSPEMAVNALERAVGEPGTIAVVAPMLGTQMLAMLPVALDARIPLITISGTAAITQQDNPFVFRFFPDDGVTKSAQVRYALDELHVRRPALITQTTAYGQSGRAEILKLLKAQGITPVYDDALDVSLRDMAPVLARAQAAGADSLLLHLHAGPTALLLKAAAGLSGRLPIVAGSGLSQPSTLALLEPRELAGACAETGSSPVSAETPAMQAFLTDYRAAFGADPDAFALAQYDGTMMALQAIASGARTPEALARALATTGYAGLAMAYRSDGRGDMAHSAVVICFDGTSRTPRVAKRYDP